MLLSCSCTKCGRKRIAPPRTFSLKCGIFGIGRHVRAHNVATHRTLVDVLRRGGVAHGSNGGCGGTGTQVIVCFPRKRCMLRGSSSGAVRPNGPMLKGRNSRTCSLSDGKGGGDSDVCVFTNRFMVGKSNTKEAGLVVSAPGLPSSVAAVCSSPMVVSVGRGSKLSGLYSVANGTTGNAFDIRMSSTTSLDGNS